MATQPYSSDRISQQFRSVSASDDCNLVDGLDYAVNIALRDEHKPIPFLSKNKIEVTVLRKKLNVYHFGGLCRRPY